MLTQDQENALQLVGDNIDAKNTIFINGYAGSGKSYLINVIIDKYAHFFDKTMVLTYTNKALDVLVDKLNTSRGYESRTLHSFIYGAPDKYGNWVPRVDKLFNGLIIIDEVSMVPDMIFDELKKKLSQCMIILVGDTFQLESVGGSPIDLGAFPTYTLKEVVRYQNGILDTANSLRVDNRLKLNKDVKIITNFEDTLKFAAKDDYNFVVLTATNRARVGYNKMIRASQQRKEPITENESLITLNNTNFFSNGSLLNIPKLPYTELTVPYKNTKLKAYRFVYNELTFLLFPDFMGASLHLAEFQELNIQDKFEIFGEDNVEMPRGQIKDVVLCTYAYAISCWKAQGSQFDLVFIDFDYCNPEWNNRRWLYTAITRATTAVRLVYTKTLEPLYGE